MLSAHLEEWDAVAEDQIRELVVFPVVDGEEHGPHEEGGEPHVPGVVNPHGGERAAVDDLHDEAGDVEDEVDDDQPEELAASAVGIVEGLVDVPVG